MRRSPTEISDLLKFGAEFVRAINNQCNFLFRGNRFFRLEIQTFFECGINIEPAKRVVGSFILQSSHTLKPNK